MKTKIIFKGNPFPSFSPPADFGDFMKPNWAISDFMVWWGVEGVNGQGFIKQLDDVLDQ